MKIGIVGTGLVGSTAAYAMIMRGIGREIVFVDKNEKRVRAETADLLHAVPFAHPLTLIKGKYKDLKGSRLVIISAGVSQKPDESRLDLLKRNASVFKEIIPKIIEHAPDTILVVATNPLDIMTFLTARYAADLGFSTNRVLGTGTMLDTARFRSLIGLHLGVDPQHIHGYVIGEHGDSEVLAWSLTTVGAMHLKEYCDSRNINFDDEVRNRIEKEVRNAAYEIIEGKGATYYGIGSALAKIADVIIHNQRSILTVSIANPAGLDVADIAISTPHLVGGEGIISSIPLPMDKKEHVLLIKSAEKVGNAIAELN